MSMIEEDVQYDMYIQDMHEGYVDCLESLSNAKNLDELADRLQELEDYTNQYPELLTRKSENKGLKEQVLSFDTIIKLARNSLSKRSFLLSISIAFLLGLAVNFTYDLLKGWF